jgi:subtilisin family serine protease
MIVQWTPEIEGNVIKAPELGTPGTDPSGAYYRACQWNLDQIDAPAAWNAGIFGDGVTVAVLDSGVDPDHIDLFGKVDLANSVSVLTNSPCGPVDELYWFDFRYHGTLVASQITGNGLGMASVAPGAEIVAVKTNSCLGSGTFGDLIAGILYAADLAHVDIINMSLGGYFAKNEVQGLLPAVTKAVNYANSKGKLVVASAGNGDDYGVGINLDKDKNYVHLPSEAGTAVSVYATNYYDQLAGYSNYGRSGTWIGAPGGGAPPPAPLAECPWPEVGGSVLGACSSYSVFFSCYDPLFGAVYYLRGATGTSFAAPTAAGVAALMEGNYSGGLNPGQLRSALAKTADDLGKKGTDALYSHGRVNAGEAAQY